jgi:flagellar hook-basal body complex protein FliE
MSYGIDINKATEGQLCQVPGFTAELVEEILQIVHGSRSLVQLTDFLKLDEDKFFLLSKAVKNGHIAFITPLESLMRQMGLGESRQQSKDKRIEELNYKLKTINKHLEETKSKREKEVKDKELMIHQIEKELKEAERRLQYVFSYIDKLDLGEFIKDKKDELELNTFSLSSWEKLFDKRIKNLSEEKGKIESLIEREETQKESEKAGTSRSAITEAVVVVPESLGKCVKNALEEAEVNENMTETNVAALNIIANVYKSDKKLILSAAADTVCQDNSDKVDVLAAGAGGSDTEKCKEFQSVDVLSACAGESAIENEYESTMIQPCNCPEQWISGCIYGTSSVKKSNDVHRTKKQMNFKCYGQWRVSYDKRFKAVKKGAKSCT